MATETRPAHLRLPNHDDAQAWARKYSDKGLPYLFWQVTDEDAGSGKGKGPTGLDATGWNSTRIYELPPAHPKPWQMGLFTGAEVSGQGREGMYLAVVDVDDPMMQAAVEASLPKTGLVGGREGAKRSHLFYLVTDGTPNSFKWLGSRRNEDGSESDGCLLELMGCSPNGTPRQVVVAPSRHYRTATDVVWAEFGEPAQIKAEELYTACVRALSVRQGQARLEGKGRPKPAIRATKESKKVRLAGIAAKAQETEGERAGKPKATAMTKDAIEAVIWHAEEAVKNAEKGNVQNVLNAQAYNAASLLEGGDAEESWFERLEERLTQAFDEKEGEGHDVRKWITTVRRGIEQGRAAPRTRGAMQGFELNDQGNADLLAQEWRDTYRFLTTGASDGGGKSGHRGWHEWDGRKWAPVDPENLFRATKDVFRWAGAEAFNSTDKDWCDSAVTHYLSTSQSRGKAMAAVDFLRSSLESGNGLAVARETVDTDRWLVNCANGIYDIKAGVLLPHDRTLLMTKYAPYNYIPGSKSEIAERAMMWAFAEQPDQKACYDYLMSWFGYMATGDVSAQQLLVLFGNGQNGKSHLVEAVGRALGSYAGTVQKSVLIQANGGSESKCTDEIAELQGRRMGWFSELSMTEFLNEGRIKQLTGNSRIRARRLFEGSFEFDTHCKFIVDTNYQPKIRGTDFGILRRVKPLPYNRKIADDAKVPDWQGMVLAAEGDGLLSMVLEAAHEYSKHGLAAEPACVVAACEMFREDNDNIGCFVRECCESEDEEKRAESQMKVGAHDIYDRYRRWAIDGGYTPCNIKTFGAKLMEKGFEQVRTAGCRVWLGLRLAAGGMNELMQAADAVVEKQKKSA